MCPPYLFSPQTPALVIDWHLTVDPTEAKRFQGALPLVFIDTARTNLEPLKHFDLTLKHILLPESNSSIRLW